MRTLKKEFTFKFGTADIKVQLVGSVFCAIFGTLAKPLVIENGKILLKEDNKYLADITDDAYIDPIEILKQIKELLNSIDL